MAHGVSLVEMVHLFSKGSSGRPTVAAQFFGLTILRGWFRSSSSVVRNKRHKRGEMGDYSRQGLNMGWKRIFGHFLACTALIVLGYLYLDIRLAVFVCDKLGEGFLRTSAISDLPDLLFFLVCAVCIVSWSGRLWLPRKYVGGWILNFMDLIGCSVPLAFILKHFLKQMFGQIETRIWLLHPEQFGFHWFQGGGDYAGFPSGHMAVFTALMLGISRYFPRLRPVCAGLLFSLALALVVTEYHFFSDIVAGFYLGVVVD